MEDFKDYFLRSHITDETRRARRNLLITCAAIFLVTYGDFMPRQLPVLGIDVEATQRDSLIALLAVVLAYYFFKFYIYMQVDGRASMYKAEKALLGASTTELDAVEFRAALKRKYKEVPRIYGWSFVVWVSLRIFIEITIPLFAAAWAVACLAWY